MAAARVDRAGPGGCYRAGSASTASAGTVFSHPHAYTHRDFYADPHSYRYPHTHAHTYSYCHTHTHAYAYAHTYVYPHAYAHADRYACCTRYRGISPRTPGHRTRGSSGTAHLL